MKLKLIFWAMALVIFTGCIKDDLIDDRVEPMLRISIEVDTLALGSSFSLESIYLNEIGMPEEAVVAWRSSDSEVIEVNQSGLAAAKSEGSATIYAEVESLELIDSVLLHVGNLTTTSSQVRSGTITTTTFYDLEGDFTLAADDGDLVLEIAENYVASSSLPGLYLYLTNNPNSIAGAHEIGEVEVFSGAHSYLINDVALEDFGYLLYYCKPFNVKVGDGKIE